MEELEGVAAPAKEALPSVPPGLDAIQQQLWDLLKQQPEHIDNLARQANRPIHEVAGALMMLEMKKAVRRLPGNQYERV